jgi:hypothetical protein
VSEDPSAALFTSRCFKSSAVTASWRLGRDWLTDLADELHRTFVEAYDRPFEIGRFGIEIKHVLNPGDVFAIDLRNAPHVFAPGFEVIFRQASPYRLERQAVVFGEFDYRTCQQLIT